MNRAILILLATMCSSSGLAQTRLPILDMHIHAYAADTNGPPPIAICIPLVTQFPPQNGSRAWVDVWTESLKNPSCPDPVWSSSTDESLMAETIAVMDKHNVIGVLSGTPDRVRQWQDAAPERFILSADFVPGGDPEADDLFVPLEEFRQFFRTGEFSVIGEVAPQYIGISPTDERLEPYWELAEEIDVPVAFHMAEGIPGGTELWIPAHRTSLTNPLLLDDVLARHPGLRLSVMHFGSPLIDEMIAILAAYPLVYIDLGGMQWYYPREYFYGQLKQFVDAGFVKRIMFGSDQMNWPGLIERSITLIEEAPFLSEEEKRDIFYNNAARFLRLSEQRIAAHHAL